MAKKGLEEINKRPGASLTKASMCCRAAVRRRRLGSGAQWIPFPRRDRGLGHAKSPEPGPFESDPRRLLPLSADLLCKTPVGRRSIR